MSVLEIFSALTLTQDVQLIELHRRRHPTNDLGRSQTSANHRFNPGHKNPGLLRFIAYLDVVLSDCQSNSGKNLIISSNLLAFGHVDPNGSIWVHVGTNGDL